eukprot:TRINITY_DN1897_c0_g2_i2.p1 TRINITY_DN1897_c0_g2~~TRINITY_DN1897_c0_g2_i2.p1  ORF type:complete len:627 (-),score=106.76 TRINITY_DN1897_c0_g2_i2:264-2144(-)
MRINSIAVAPASHTDHTITWADNPSSQSNAKDASRTQQKGKAKVLKESSPKSRATYRDRPVSHASHAADLSSAASGSGSSSATSTSSCEDQDRYRSQNYSHEDDHHTLSLEANEAFGWHNSLGDDVLDPLAPSTHLGPVSLTALHHPLLPNTFPSSLHGSKSAAVSSNSAHGEGHTHTRGSHSGTGKGRVSKEGLKREAKMKKERARRAKLHDRFVELAEALGLTEEARVDRLTLLTESLRSVRSMQEELNRLRTHNSNLNANSNHAANHNAHLRPRVQPHGPTATSLGTSLGTSLATSLTAAAAAAAAASTPASASASASASAAASVSMALITPGLCATDPAPHAENYTKPHGQLASPAEHSSDASSSPLTVPHARRMRTNGPVPSAPLAPANLASSNAPGAVAAPHPNHGNPNHGNPNHGNPNHGNHHISHNLHSASAPFPTAKGSGLGLSGPMGFNGPASNIPLSMSVPMSMAMQMGMHGTPQQWWSSYHSAPQAPLHQIDHHFLSAQQGPGVSYPGSAAAAAVAAANWSRWMSSHGHSLPFHPSQLHFSHPLHGASTIINGASSGIDYGQDHNDHTYAISSNDEDVHLLDPIHDPIHDHFYDHTQLQDHDAGPTDGIPTPYL